MLQAGKKCQKAEMSYTEVIKQLSEEVSADWEEIGELLQLNQGSLNSIKGDNPNQSKKCFWEMIKLWFKQVDPYPSWSAIAEALEVLQYKSLAKNLKDNFCIT